MKKILDKKPLHRLLSEAEGEHRLKRALGPLALMNLGIGCIIGAGIFVMTGLAAHSKAGPVLSVSYAVAGFACAMAALCYAEFAAMVPVAGSAYTYAYATLGELFAWIVGWDLLLEYTVAAASVASGWSGYMQDLLRMFGMRIPRALSGAPFDTGVTGRPVATHMLIDLFAVLIVAALTALLVKGIVESTLFNNIMVGIKIGVVLFVIAVGLFYIHPANWHPFAPFGWGGLVLFGHTFGQVGRAGEPLGMLAGAAIIFYAYIGFDTVSAHSEEARNPQRDVPIGIIGSLLICTILYIAVTVVITGMVPCASLDIKAPIAMAFRQVGLPWAELIIAVGALIGITTVLLALMLGQPRVMLAMARDGLVPPYFAAIHNKFRTPWKATILNGAVVCVLAAVLPLKILAELVNIGTLLAFLVVCAAVLVMRKTHPDAARPFRCPWVPVVPILGIIFCLGLMLSLPTVNWIRLIVWLAAGLVIYMTYGRRHSALRQKPLQADHKPSDSPP
jgi:APA family basic amino acid/polyamine antiporter